MLSIWKISRFCYFMREMYHFWLSENISNSYNVNKLFIILKNVVEYLYIYFHKNLNFVISTLK